MSAIISASAVAHSFLAIGAGFATTALLTAAATLIATRVAPQKEDSPSRGYRLFNLLGSVLFAMAGGYVTATVASASPLPHALMLALVLLLLSAISAVQLGRGQPLGYQLALTAAAPLGAIAGAILRLHVLGYL